MNLFRTAALAIWLFSLTVTTQAADTPVPPVPPWAADITAGQIQDLQAGSEHFPAVYTPSQDAPLGGIILLPDMDAHPDWPDVIAPLRRGLPLHGWSTLAISLPTPARNPDGTWQLAPYFTGSSARVQSAAAFLQQQGIKNIVVLGHGLGAAAAAVSAAGPDKLPIAALITIGLSVPPKGGEHPYKTDLFETLTVPVLDIIGSREQDEVKDGAARRKTVAKRGARAAARPLAYRQWEAAGVDHLFRGVEDALLKKVTGWLKKAASGAGNG